jgi:hypothetical protein
MDIGCLISNCLPWPPIEVAHRGLPSTVFTMFVYPRYVVDYLVKLDSTLHHGQRTRGLSVEGPTMRACLLLLNTSRLLGTSFGLCALPLRHAPLPKRNYPDSLPQDARRLLVLSSMLPDRMRKVFHGLHTDIRMVEILEESCRVQRWRGMNPGARRSLIPIW